MIKIAIIGSNKSYFTKDIIIALLKVANLKVIEVLDFDDIIINESKKDVDIIVLNVSDEMPISNERFNILILNAENNYRYKNQLIKNLTADDYLLIDFDNKDVLKGINKGDGRLITCGFNPKACITTSSVMDNEYKTIQVCIQHALKTIGKKTIDEQEFSINISGEGSNVIDTLLAVCCVILCDISIDTIT